MTDKDTVKFTVPSDDKENMRRILRNVYEALTEKGYNPVNQIVGYLLTEDPTYITNYNNARSMICKIDRDELYLVRHKMGISYLTLLQIPIYQIRISVNFSLDVARF